MKHRNEIALCLIFAAILTAEVCIPAAAGCVAAALVLTAFKGEKHGHETRDPA